MYKPNEIKTSTASAVLQTSRRMHLGKLQRKEVREHHQDIQHELHQSLVEEPYAQSRQVLTRVVPDGTRHCQHDDHSKVGKHDHTTFDSLPN
ncbi:MAG: hypothetical protein U5R31_17015 [Acidimicrobiia bacterium]|nr:hypothetical protein [Acidimicrobiia bacterium]